MQVVASSRKLNLPIDLRWVAKRTRQFPHLYTQVAENHILYFMANNRLMDVTQLALTLVEWPNGEKLATCEFDLDQSECKLTQVHTRSGQTESQVDPSFQLYSPVRLARTLDLKIYSVGSIK